MTSPSRHGSVRPGRPRRGEQPHLLHRELPLRQHLPHHATDLAGGPHNADPHAREATDPDPKPGPLSHPRVHLTPLPTRCRSRFAVEPVPGDATSDHGVAGGRGGEGRQAAATSSSADHRRVALDHQGQRLRVQVRRLPPRNLGHVGGRAAARAAWRGSRPGRPCTTSVASARGDRPRALQLHRELPGPPGRGPPPARPRSPRRPGYGAISPTASTRAGAVTAVCTAGTDREPAEPPGQREVAPGCRTCSRVTSRIRWLSREVNAPPSTVRGQRHRHVVGVRPVRRRWPEPQRRLHRAGPVHQDDPPAGRAAARRAGRPARRPPAGAGERRRAQRVQVDPVQVTGDEQGAGPRSHSRGRRSRPPPSAPATDSGSPCSGRPYRFGRAEQVGPQRGVGARTRVAPSPSAARSTSSSRTRATSAGSSRGVRTGLGEQFHGGQQPVHRDRHADLERVPVDRRSTARCRAPPGRARTRRRRARAVPSSSALASTAGRPSRPTGSRPAPASSSRSGDGEVLARQVRGDDLTAGHGAGGPPAGTGYGRAAPGPGRSAIERHAVSSGGRSGSPGTRAEHVGGGLGHLVGGDGEPAAAAGTPRGPGRRTAWRTGRAMSARPSTVDSCRHQAVVSSALARASSASVTGSVASSSTTSASPSSSSLGVHAGLGGGGDDQRRRARAPGPPRTRRRSPAGRSARRRRAAGRAGCPGRCREPWRARSPRRSPAVPNGWVRCDEVDPRRRHVAG